MLSGWSLAPDPRAITLGPVCKALGERLLFAVDLAAPSGCSVQAAFVEVGGPSPERTLSRGRVWR